MPPDALPQLIDALLRLPLLDLAQLRELIEHLPDPQAAAGEMVRRGWITQNQFCSLFPGLDEKGVGTHLPERPEECCAQMGPDPFFAQGEQAEAPLASPLPVAPQRRWAGKGLLIGTLLLGIFVAGLQFFRAKPTVAPAPQESSHAKRGDPAKAGDPTKAVESPPAPPLVPLPLDLPALYAQVVQALATRDNRAPSRQAVIRDNCSPSRQEVIRDNSSPSMAIPDNGTPFRQTVLRNPIAPQVDPRQWVILQLQVMAGQRSAANDASNPLKKVDRTLPSVNPSVPPARPNDGGADAKTFLGDGRPIVGIAGMVSNLNFGPAFCLCLVTTKPGAIADADGLSPGRVPINHAEHRDDLLNTAGQNAQPAAPVTEPVAERLRTRPIPPLHTKPAAPAKAR